MLHVSGCQQQQALHAREVVICGCTYVLALLHVCTGLQSTVAGGQRFVNGCNTLHPLTYVGHCVWSPISHRQSLPFLLSCRPAECLAHGQSHNRKRMHRIGVFCHTKCAIVRILSQASRAGQHVRRYGTHHGHRGDKRPPPPHLAPQNFELNLHHSSSSNPIIQVSKRWNRSVQGYALLTWHAKAVTGGRLPAAAAALALAC